MSEVEFKDMEFKRALIAEDRINIRTYRDISGSETLYSSDLEVNGKEYSGDTYSKELALGHIRMLTMHIYKKAKALYYVNDPGTADALANDIARDAAELIAATRALADTVKGREAH